MIHPIVVGASNALIPGLGYLIIRERVVFGGLLIAGSLALFVLTFVEPVFIPESFLVSSSLLGKGLEGLWYLCFTLAYGYDAYALARSKQQAPGTSEPVLETPN